MASDYAHSCTATDENLNDPSVTPGCMILSDRCDVYVWGSNSSHQLAGGSQEKILQPKASTAFHNVQQVRKIPWILGTTELPSENTTTQLISEIYNRSENDHATGPYI